MRPRRAALLALPLAAAIAGCGTTAPTDSPDAALAALAQAVNAGDDAAVGHLICPAARGAADSMDRVHDGLVMLDPAFAGAGWHAEAGDVQPTGDTTATATLTITRVGWPDVRTPELAEFLDGSSGPQPIDLVRDGKIELVLADGQWLACG